MRALLLPKLHYGTNSSRGDLPRVPSRHNHLATSTPARIFRNLHGDLQVRCSFVDGGCQTVVRLGNLQQHTAGCGFAPVVCANAGCGKQMLRQDRDEHQENERKWREVVCEHCSSKMPFSHLEGQLRVCPTCVSAPRLRSGYTTHESCGILIAKTVSREW